MHFKENFIESLRLQYHTETENHWWSIRQCMNRFKTYADTSAMFLSEVDHENTRCATDIPFSKVELL